MFGFLDPIMEIPRMMFQEEQQNDAQQFALGTQEASQNFNSAQAIANRDFQERMSNTQYQRATADMKAAGLNPMLAYHQGGAGTPHGGQAAASPSSAGLAAGNPSGPSHFQQSMQSASQIELNRATEEKTRAEAERARAEKTEIEARTPTHAVSIDKMKQQIDESKTLIQKMLQETTTSAYSAQYLDQQAINLRALLPKIQATVDQLRAQTKLTTAETHLRHEQIGLTMQQESEVRQRIKANLPEIERAVRDLEKIARELDMPRREQDAISNDRFVGSLGALLRTLIPLSNFIPSYR